MAAPRWSLGSLQLLFTFCCLRFRLHYILEILIQAAVTVPRFPPSAPLRKRNAMTCAIRFGFACSAPRCLMRLYHPDPDLL